MSARDIISSLWQKGLELAADGENIRVEPKSRLTDEARSVIRNNKSELLAYLNRTAPTKYKSLDPGLPHAAWRLAYPNGSTRQMYTLPPATRAEVHELWPEATWAEPFAESKDSRRYCTQCRNLTGEGLCLAAKALGASSRYHPLQDLPRHCKAFAALAGEH